MNSRGFYAGIEVTGQVFLDRFDENERVYYWPGIKAGDILDGKVKVPECAEPLIRALREAEYGVAQAGVLEKMEMMKNLPSSIYTENLERTLDSLQEGEHIQLPPTPEQLDAMEHAGYKDEYDEALEEQERQEIRSLPPPPIHPSAKKGQRNISGSTQSPKPPVIPAKHASRPSTEIKPAQPKGESQINSKNLENLQPTNTEDKKSTN